MNLTDRHALIDACETFKIKLPAAIIDADKVAAATAQLVAEISAEIEPDAYSISVDNLADLHRAMVAWPAHDDRRKAADRLAQVADTYLSTAWDGFVGALIEAFRKPFDAAVAGVLADDADALQAARQLARVREVLANNGRRAKLRSDTLERVTRLLVVPSYEVALNRIRFRTEGMEPLTRPWCEALLAIGCQIKWQSPDDQEAADCALPVNTPAPAA